MHFQVPRPPRLRSPLHHLPSPTGCCRAFTIPRLFQWARRDYQLLRPPLFGTLTRRVRFVLLPPPGRLLSSGRLCRSVADISCAFDSPGAAGGCSCCCFLVFCGCSRPPASPDALIYCDVAGSAMASVPDSTVICALLDAREPALVGPWFTDPLYFYARGASGPSGGRIRLDPLSSFRSPPAAALPLPLVRSPHCSLSRSPPSASLRSASEPRALAPLACPGSLLNPCHSLHWTVGRRSPPRR